MSEPLKLRPAQARKLADAEAAVFTAKRALERAKQERDTVRARYRDRLPLGEWVQIAGLAIKRIVKRSGPSFRLSAYLEQHKLTPEMQPFVGKGTEYEHIDIQSTKHR